jgi:hypothetical protein
MAREQYGTSMDAYREAVTQALESLEAEQTEPADPAP